MKVKTIRDGEAIVALTAEECGLISYACKDGSTTDNVSLSGALAQMFGSLSDVVLLTVDAE